MKDALRPLLQLIFMLLGAFVIVAFASHIEAFVQPYLVNFQ